MSQAWQMTGAPQPQNALNRSNWGTGSSSASVKAGYPPHHGGGSWLPVQHTPAGVCTGASLVEGTRIGVHDVVGRIINGIGGLDGVRGFPELMWAPVLECQARYADQRKEIDWRMAMPSAGTQDHLSASP